MKRSDRKSIIQYVKRTLLKFEKLNETQSIKTYEDYSKYSNVIVQLRIIRDMLEGEFD